MSAPTGTSARFDAAAAARVLAQVRLRRPLVHNIANQVAMEATCDMLLAVGASPAAVVAPEEAAEFARGADALAANIGTLTRERLQALRGAAGAMRAAGRPWVLDPVGLGGSAHRGAAARELLALRPTVLRANAGEVALLAGTDASALRGVDAAISTDAVASTASDLARDASVVVAMTGAVDVVASETGATRLVGGHELMARVTGMGCGATALVAAALAVEPDARVASLAALAWLAVAGEAAAERCDGPGSFRVALLDALHGLDAAKLAARAWRTA
ncbi:MAG: hydroxyethylthiazole kinase [Alphaproteobacteria bacterium]